MDTDYYQVQLCDIGALTLASGSAYESRGAIWRVRSSRQKQEWRGNLAT